MIKKKSTRSVAVAGVLVTLVLAGCAEGGAPAEQEPQIDLAAEEEAVVQVNIRWLELARARDADGIGALFVEDGWAYSAANGVAEGREGIIARLRKDFEENPESVNDWGAKEAWVAGSGDLAVERGWWTEDKDGEGEGEAIEGEYTTVFVKVDGEWKILTDSGGPVGGVQAE